MHPILLSVLETAGVTLLAASGALAGRRLAQIPRWWHLGYALPLLLITVISVPRWLPTAAVWPPFRWLMEGRLIFALMAPLCGLLLFTLRAHLKPAGQKRAVMAFTGVFVVYFSALPFLMPGFAYPALSRLKPHEDRFGVCMQQTPYTCGPASAVTMLRALGLDSDEGRLAILAHTNAFIGTTNGCLCAAIREDTGVACHTESFDSVAQLRGRTPCIAVVKFSMMNDHFVTVIGVTEGGVLIGDPVSGLRIDTPEQFAGIWRRTAIVADAADAGRRTASK